MLCAIALLALSPVQASDTDKLRGIYDSVLEGVPKAERIGTSATDFAEKIQLFFIRPSRYHIEFPGLVIDGFVEWKGDTLNLFFERGTSMQNGSRELKDLVIVGIDRAQSDRIVKWIVGNPQLKISKDLKRIDVVTPKEISPKKFYFERRWAE